MKQEGEDWDKNGTTNSVARKYIRNGTYLLSKETKQVLQQKASERESK